MYVYIYVCVYVCVYLAMYQISTHKIYIYEQVVR